MYRSPVAVGNDDREIISYTEIVGYTERWCKYCGTHFWVNSKHIRFDKGDCRRIFNARISQFRMNGDIWVDAPLLVDQKEF